MLNKHLSHSLQLVCCFVLRVLKKMYYILKLLSKVQLKSCPIAISDKILQIIRLPVLFTRMVKVRPPFSACRVSPVKRGFYFGHCCVFLNSEITKLPSVIYVWIFKGTCCTKNVTRRSLFIKILIEWLGEIWKIMILKLANTWLFFKFNLKIKKL